MRVTLPVAIDTDEELTSSSAAEIHEPTAYSAGATYAVGDVISVAADYAVYESLLANNINHTPSTSPLWWRQIGYTETAYSSGTTYALNQTCSFDHRVYKSLAAGNTGNALPIPPATLTTKWQYVGPTNKWAMFDLASNTQTVVAGSITVVVKPGGRINTVGVTGMQANSLTISATSVFGGGTVYGPVTKDLNTREVIDAYDYAFNLFSTRASWAFFDLPPFSDIIITLTLTADSGNVKCGSVVCGNYIWLGEAQTGARGGELNFSTVERDLYGNATLTPRRSVPKTSQTLFVSTEYVNRIREARKALNAAPALWTGMDDTGNDYFDLLLVTGIYKTFEINAPHTEMATINLEIEEI